MSSTDANGTSSTAASSNASDGTNTGRSNALGLTPHDLFPVITEAIVKGDVERVRQLLPSTDVNAIDVQDDLTLLTSAVYHAREDIVTLLVDEGAEVDKPDGCGTTALVTAVDEKNGDMVTLLLGKGANVDALCGDGRTALMHAAENGEDEIAGRLLTARADVNTVDDGGYTALMLAAVNGHCKIVERLLNATAEVDKADATGRTALMHAAENGEDEIAERLLTAGADVNTVDSEACTALMLAAEGGHDEIVKRLLDAGAEADKADDEGRTALMLAAENGEDGIAERLLAAGAIVDTVDGKQCTALMLAAEGGHDEIVERLLDAGAEVDKADGEGRTALAIANAHAEQDVVDLLISKGARPLPASESPSFDFDDSASEDDDGARTPKRSRSDSGSEGPDDSRQRTTSPAAHPPTAPEQTEAMATKDAEIQDLKEQIARLRAEKQALEDDQASAAGSSSGHSAGTNASAIAALEEQIAQLQSEGGECDSVLPLTGVRPAHAKLLKKWYEAAPRSSLDDTVGCDNAKALLRQRVLDQSDNPDLLVSAVLLFGPSGTGKTSLAKALASELGRPFFNVKATVIAEANNNAQLIIDLFKCVRAVNGVLLLDEGEILFKTGASNRVATCKQEMQTEDKRALVIVTSNKPWVVDEDMLRRFQVRALVDLPDGTARRAMLETFFRSQPKAFSATDEQWEAAMRTADGFSGSDLHEVFTNSKLRANNQPQILFDDLQFAIKKVKRTNDADAVKKLKDWNKEHGTDHVEPRPDSQPPAMPTDVASLLKAVEERDFGVLQGVESKYAKPGISALCNACESHGVVAPPAAVKYLKDGKPYGSLPNGFSIVKAPDDWRQSKTLSTYMHQISLQASTRLEASGRRCHIVMFQQGRKTHAILTSLEALAARRAVAAAAAADKSSLEAFMSLRKMKPEQSNWKRLQSMLFSAGLSVCPTSGTPVMDIESCSKELQDASWAVLTALQKAINSEKKEINSKETVKLDEALNQLSFMISDPTSPARSSGSAGDGAGGDSGGGGNGSDEA